MLRQEQNDLLTRPIPAPDGRLFRSYCCRRCWRASCLRTMSAGAVKLLSERLLAWRDSQGRYSLIDEFAPIAHLLWSGATRRMGCAAPITAGNTISGSSLASSAAASSCGTAGPSGCRIGLGEEIVLFLSEHGVTVPRPRLRLRAHDILTPSSQQ